jgi:NAD-dependent dihydropyrimidine dehydrogenase PreA subunit
MSYIISQPCIGEKNSSCVEVCPVDCIHTNEEADQYFIDPEECISCGACVDTCPVDAIFPEDEIPEKWKQFVTINANFFNG